MFYEIYKDASGNILAKIEDSSISAEDTTIVRETLSDGQTRISYTQSEVESSLTKMTDKDGLGAATFEMVIKPGHEAIDTIVKILTINQVMLQRKRIFTMSDINDQTESCRLRDALGLISFFEFIYDDESDDPEVMITLAGKIFLDKIKDRYGVDNVDDLSIVLVKDAHESRSLFAFAQKSEEPPIDKSKLN